MHCLHTRGGEPVKASQQPAQKGLFMTDSSSDPAFDLDKFLAKVKRQREQAMHAAEQIDLELVRFNGENAPIDFNVDWSHETVWATQRQMAGLFGKDPDTIGHHVAG